MSTYVSSRDVYCITGYNRFLCSAVGSPETPGGASSVGRGISLVRPPLFSPFFCLELNTKIPAHSRPPPHTTTQRTIACPTTHRPPDPVICLSGISGAPHFRFERAVMPFLTWGDFLLSRCFSFFHVRLARDGSLSIHISTDECIYFRREAVVSIFLFSFIIHLHPSTGKTASQEPRIATALCHCHVVGSRR